jgi:uncharacterized protein
MATSTVVRLATLLSMCLPGAAAAQQPRPLPLPSAEPVVVTSGEGIVRAAPNRAYMDVTAESRAASPRDAQRKTAEIMSQVQDRLRALGINADAMRTTVVNLNRHYDYVNGRQIARDYIAINSIEVRVDALDRLGELLDAAVAAGATSLGDVRFDVSDRAKYEREAVTAAVADARARAQAMAAGAGRSLDRILRIEEQGVSSPPMPMAMRMEMRGQVASAPPPTPVAPGQMEFRARVTMTTALVP